MPKKFPADGNTFIGWLEDAAGTAIADINAPSVGTELAAVVDLSCDVQSGGFTLGVTNAVIDAKSLCDAFAAQALGTTTVSPALTLWRYKDPDPDTAWDLFERGALGWLVVRTGVPSDQPLASGDKLTLAYVEASEPQPDYPGGDTLTTFTETFVLNDGQKFTQKAVAAV